MNAPLKSIESEHFLSEYKKLRKIPGAIRKLESLMCEVVIHPRTGLGHPKPLVGYGNREVWSRHISGKHRLVYEIKSDCVVFIACYGHYQDHWLHRLALAKGSSKISTVWFFRTLCYYFLSQAVFIKGGANCPSEVRLLGVFVAKFFPLTAEDFSRCCRYFIPTASVSIIPWTIFLYMENFRIIIFLCFHRKFVWVTKRGWQGQSHRPW